VAVAGRATGLGLPSCRSALLDVCKASKTGVRNVCKASKTGVRNRKLAIGVLRRIGCARHLGPSCVAKREGDDPWWLYMSDLRNPLIGVFGRE
jgi:hypothetical protein